MSYIHLMRKMIIMSTDRTRALPAFAFLQRPEGPTVTHSWLQARMDMSTHHGFPCLVLLGLITVIDDHDDDACRRPP